MTIPSLPPADPSNAKADDPAAAALGKKLFSDASLGPSAIACATCHDPTKAFTDGAEQSTGVRRVSRNAPSVLLAAHGRWQFWDGRADSLWMQALGPIESADEMGSTRLEVVHAIGAKYRGVADSAPFGHGGTVPDFEELTLLYGKAGLDSADSRAVGAIEPWVAKFSEHHRPPIETILKVLTGTPAP